MKGVKIHDEFTDLDVSHERKRQLRQLRDGLCVRCNQPLADANHCLKHAIERREYYRRRNGWITRYKSAHSYRLQEAHP